MDDRRVLESRQNNRRIVFYTLVAVCALLLVVAVIGGAPVHGCVIPLFGLVGLFAIAQGADVYFHSRKKRKPVTNLLEQEMIWLYGPDWQQKTGAREIVIAQERIRQRRVRRWQFMIIFAPIFIVVVGFTILMASFLAEYGQPGGNLAIGFAILMAVMLIFVANRVFPIAASLRRQEQAFARSLHVDQLEKLPETFVYETPKDSNKRQE